MNDKAAVGRLKRFGEVPPPSTDDRRSWLLALTRDDLTTLTRFHGVDEEPFSECLGFGAYHAGTDPDEQVACEDCGRIGLALFFMNPDGYAFARCWPCSAIRHLTDCEKWSVPE